MTRANAIRDRLPTLYRDGALLGALLDVAALQLEVVAERGLDVQRAHWFDLADSLEEAAALGALLDLPPEPWQRRLGEYRAWVHALRDARLRHGAVTLRAVETFVTTYLTGFSAANRVDIVGGLGGFERAEPAERAERTEVPALVENPPLRRVERLAAVAPLERFDVVNGGLDPAPLGLLLTGLGDRGPEHVPVVVNLTTGRALAWLGSIPAGQRLELRTQEGRASAHLEGVDVSDRLRSVALTPGVAWGADDAEVPAAPLVLAPGRNALWFLPIAHYDAPGLDRALLAMASVTGDELRSVPAPGRWDDAQLDRDVFVAEAAITLSAVWRERTPVAFEVVLPASTLVARDGDETAALVARDRLASSLQVALDRLAAAGVTASVRLRPHRSVQRSRDRLAAVLPLTTRDVGPTGADRLPDAGGVFGVTSLDDSTFR